MYQYHEGNSNIKVTHFLESSLSLRKDTNWLMPAMLVLQSPAWMSCTNCSTTPSLAGSRSSLMQCSSATWSPDMNSFTSFTWAWAQVRQCCAQFQCPIHLLPDPVIHGRGQLEVAQLVQQLLLLRLYVHGVENSVKHHLKIFVCIDRNIYGHSLFLDSLLTWLYVTDSTSW